MGCATAKMDGKDQNAMCPKKIVYPQTVVARVAASKVLAAVSVDGRAKPATNVSIQILGNLSLYATLTPTVRVINIGLM